MFPFSILLLHQYKRNGPWMCPGNDLAPGHHFKVFYKYFVLQTTMERSSDDIISNSSSSSSDLSQIPSLPSSLFPKQSLFPYSFWYHHRSFFPSTNVGRHFVYRSFWHSLTVDFCIIILKMFAFFNITSSGFPSGSAGGRFAWMQLEFKRLIVSSVGHMKIRQPQTLLANLSA